MTGEELKAARLALGKSQTALAARLGVHQGTISKWEKIGIPTYGTARKAIESVLHTAPTAQPVEAKNV